MFQKKDTRISNNYVKRINKALNVVLLKEIMKFMEGSRVISNPKVFQSLPLLEIPLKKPTHIQNPSINLQSNHGKLSLLKLMKESTETFQVNKETRLNIIMLRY